MSKKLIFIYLVTGGLLASAQKKGTLVIEPDVKQFFKIGPVYTDMIYASQLCPDSIKTVSCTDPDVVILSYRLSIELNREIVLNVKDNLLPDTMCRVVPRLRGGEIVYVDQIKAMDSNGEVILLPPARFMVYVPQREAPARREYYDTNDY